MELISSVSKTKVQTKNTSESLHRLEEKFKELLGGEDEEITFEQFKSIINSKNLIFAERMFKIFDKTNSGTVSLEEFMSDMWNFARLNPNEKLKYLFTIYDLDGDGSIQKDELKKVIRACMEENGLCFSERELDELTQMMFDDADAEDSDCINFQQFEAQLTRHAGLTENICASLDNWLLPQVKTEKKQPLIRWPTKLTWKYINNNKINCVFFVAIVVVNLALFIGQALNYSYKYCNGFVIVARACGLCLNFNCAFVMVLILRRSITWLRSRGVSEFLPLDNHIYYHKITGWMIAGFSIVHTIAHIGNLASPSNINQCLVSFDATKSDLLEKVFSNSSNEDYTLGPFNLTQSEPAEELFSNSSGNSKCPWSVNPTLNHSLPELLFSPSLCIGTGWIPGTACLTGWILIITLLIIVCCSLPFVRRGGNFEIFYYMHHFFIVFWAVLLIHGPNFYWWILLPGIIYLIEAGIRIHWYTATKTKAYIQRGVLLPSRVTHLVIKRPANFDYSPGDYVFINIPTITKYEWHPFTISSAPEHKGELWLHIREAGGWTKRLHRFFEKQQKEALNTSNQEVLRKTLKTWSNEGHKLPPTIGNALKNDTVKEDNGVSEDHIIEMEDVGKQRAESRLSPRMPRQQFKRSRNIQRLTSVRISASSGNFRRTGTTIFLPTMSEENEDEEEATKDDTVERVPSLTPSLKELEARNEDVVLSRLSQRLYIDGPYGSASNNIFKAQHAVLIATGIGVTPFASILQSIMYRYRASKHKCPKCSHEWGEKFYMSDLKKVDFFWLNRQPKAFEWFVNLMSQLEIEQASLSERFLDMHMYVTSALNKTDIKALGLQMALDLLHAKEHRCLITGLKTRTQPGRPDWNKVFQEISSQNKGRVTVFFCGPPELGKVLQAKCCEFGFRFKKEVF